MINFQTMLTVTDREHMSAGEGTARRFMSAIAEAAETRNPDDCALWWSGLLGALTGMVLSSIGPASVAEIAEEIKTCAEICARERAH